MSNDKKIRVEVSKDTPFKCSVNGIELDVFTLGELNRFYEASCTAEYIKDSDKKGLLTNEQAMEAGYETRRFMDKYGYEEDEAIDEAMDSLNYPNPFDKPDEEEDLEEDEDPDV